MIYGRGEKLFNKNEQQRLIPPPTQQKHRSIRKRNNQQQETAILAKKNNFNEIDVVGLIRVVDNPDDLEYYGNLLNMRSN